MATSISPMLAAIRGNQRVVGCKRKESALIYRAKIFGGALLLGALLYVDLLGLVAYSELAK